MANAQGSPLALTMGDPSGIGLDILLAAWARRRDDAVPPFVVYGDPDALGERARLLSIACPVVAVGSPSEAVASFGDRLPVMPISLRSTAHPGRPDPVNAGPTIAAIERAVAAVAAGEAAAVVTNPIAKHVLHTAGFKHPGHTEFLGALAEHHQPGFRAHPVMMLASDELRVVPLTVHIPLAAVPKAISASLLTSTAQTLHAALRSDYGLHSPRIAVAGLNPHAGEGGAMGREDLEIIAPAVAALRRSGLDITGPHPADTLFHAAARRGYDAVIAMYHDQALIPLKTLAFDTGVNVTLGLPFVRTSPDHGTAFDIAGTGRARPDSLIAALKMAAAIARRRADAQP